MNILGISAYYHDSAACLIVDGEIVAAAQEERFTRLKADPSFPVNAIRIVCPSGGSRPRKSTSLFSTTSHSRSSSACSRRISPLRRGASDRSRWSMPVWIKEKLFQRTLIRDALADIFDGLKVGRRKSCFREHHVSHAASAFFPSPFENAAILTMDGVGEWATTTLATGSRQFARDREGNSFPAFARAAVLGVHLLHRLQGQLRRIQSDGPRALRRAQICAASSATT